MGDKRKDLPAGEEHAQPRQSPDFPEYPPLPEGYPDRPDASKLNTLQSQLKKDRTTRRSSQKTTRLEKYATKVGKSAKDIGAYTLIPFMMIAGPAVGYGLGWLVERKWGGAPWTGVIGLIFGLIAAFRQIFLLLARKSSDDKDNQSH